MEDQMATKQEINSFKRKQKRDFERMRILANKLIDHVVKDNGFIHIGIRSDSTNAKPVGYGFGEPAFHKAMDAAFETISGEHCRWILREPRPDFTPKQLKKFVAKSAAK
jgi:hypothetical protein